MCPHLSSQLQLQPGPGQTWGEGGITAAKQDRGWNAARFPVWGAALAQLRIRFLCSGICCLGASRGALPTEQTEDRDSSKAICARTIIGQLSWGDAGSLPSET